MNLALAAYFLGGPGAGGRLPLWEQFGRWCALLASTVLLAYPGQDFFAGAWRDLRRGRAGMDTPIVLGLVAAWAGSAWATVRGRRTGLLRRDRDARLLRSSRPRLRDARAPCRGGVLDRFAVVEPASARRVDADGRERDVAALDLLPGDLVRVRPGEIVPADGVLLEGESSFDEAVLTGEPWPRARGPGDTVVAGSCNRDQPVLLRVTRAGEASTLGQIRRLLEKGLASRPAFALLADRLAGRLVVLVLLLAGATAVFWAVRDPGAALPATVAVLLVTCPCALALATPIALSVAAGRFAGIGVLPARMAAIERLAGADTVVLDKTGTLTLSTPVLESVRTAGGLDPETALRIAAALEATATHPDCPCAPRGLRRVGGGDGSPRRSRGPGLYGQGPGRPVVDRISRLRSGHRERAAGARGAARVGSRVVAAGGRPRGPGGTRGALHVRRGASRRRDGMSFRTFGARASGARSCSPATPGSPWSAWASRWASTKRAAA